MLVGWRQPGVDVQCQAAGLWGQGEARSCAASAPGVRRADPDAATALLSPRTDPGRAEGDGREEVQGRRAAPRKVTVQGLSWEGVPTAWLCVRPCERQQFVCLGEGIRPGDVKIGSGPWLARENWTSTRCASSRQPVQRCVPARASRVCRRAVPCPGTRSACLPGPRRDPGLLPGASRTTSTSTSGLPARCRTPRSPR